MLRFVLASVLVLSLGAPHAFAQEEPQGRFEGLLIVPLAAMRTDGRGQKPVYSASVTEDGAVNGSREWRSKWFPSALPVKVAKVSRKPSYTDVELREDGPTGRTVKLRFAFAGDTNAAFEGLVIDAAEREAYLTRAYGELARNMLAGTLAQLPMPAQIEMMRFAEASGSGTKLREENLSGDVYMVVDLGRYTGEPNDAKPNRTAQVTRVINDRLLTVFKAFARPSEGATPISGLKLEIALPRNGASTSVAETDRLQVSASVGDIRRYASGELTNQQFVEACAVKFDGSAPTSTASEPVLPKAAEPVLPKAAETVLPKAANPVSQKASTQEEPQGRSEGLLVLPLAAMHLDSRGQRPVYSASLTEDGAVNGSREWRSKWFPSALPVKVTKVNRKLSYTDVELREDGPTGRTVRLRFAFAGDTNAAFEGLVIDAAERDAYLKRAYGDLARNMLAGTLAKLPMPAQIEMMRFAEASGSGTRLREENLSGGVYMVVDLGRYAGETNDAKPNRTARVARVINDRLLTVFKAFAQPSEGAVPISGLKLEIALPRYSGSTSVAEMDRLQVYASVGDIRRYANGKLTNQQFVETCAVMFDGNRISVPLSASTN